MCLKAEKMRERRERREQTRTKQIKAADYSAKMKVRVTKSYKVAYIAIQDV